VSRGTGTYRIERLLSAVGADDRDAPERRDARVHAARGADPLTGVSWAGSRRHVGCVVSRTARLLVVFGLNIALVAGLVLVGVTAHSLGVLAEGANYLADAAAVALSLFAIGRSQRANTDGGPDRFPAGAPEHASRPARHRRRCGRRRRGTETNTASIH
jgi:hypothetical protein